MRTSKAGLCECYKTQILVTIVKKSTIFNFVWGSRNPSLMVDFCFKLCQALSWNTYQTDTAADLRGRGGLGDWWQGACALPIFCNPLLFFLQSLWGTKNWSLTWSLIIHLQYTFTQILLKHVQHPIICYLAESYYILLTQHLLLR